MGPSRSSRTWWMGRRAGFPGWGFPSWECTGHVCAQLGWRGTDWGRSSVLPGEVSGGAVELTLESQLSLCICVTLDALLLLSRALFPVGRLLTTCLSCSTVLPHRERETYLSLEGPRVERSLPGRAWQAGGRECAKTWGPSPGCISSVPPSANRGRDNNDGGGLAVPPGSLGRTCLCTQGAGQLSSHTLLGTAALRDRPLPGAGEARAQSREVTSRYNTK